MTKTKITLRLPKKTIEQAKDYAVKYNISLSKLVENYLEAIALEKEDVLEITPLVKSLSGVTELISNPNLEGDYTRFLMEKHK